MLQSKTNETSDSLRLLLACMFFKIINSINNSHNKNSQ